MDLGLEACYRALATRDARFDGRLFVGVTSTGIYCRPICPARTPKREHLVFFTAAAAAQAAGFRPCLRCRPETAPEIGAWRGTSNTVTRALSLIEKGALNEADVEALAERLGLGGRQLRRLFHQHLGASPIAVAQTRRVLLAKQLIHETRLPMAEVALAAGFGSVRRFNETFQQLFDRPPSALRRGGGADVSSGPEGEVTILLRYRPPYDWPAMLAFLRARAIRGVEIVRGDRYARTIEIDGVHGTVEIAPTEAWPDDNRKRRPGTRPFGAGLTGAGLNGAGFAGTAPIRSGALKMRERNTLRAVVRFPKLSALPTIIARLRRVFDLGADPDAIGAHLAEDPILAPLVSARPGLRVPGAWDGFELAIRAVLGQQVTVTAAAGLAAKLVASYGDPLRAAGLAELGSTPVAARASRRAACADADVIDAPPPPAADGLTHVFPRPERLAGADLSTLGMPRARAATLSALAAAVVRDPHMFGARQTLEEAVLQLRAVPGVGEWTAQYIALRALREPDAFPAADIGLLRAMEDEAGTRPTPRDLLARAERWRPWRAYAAQHLWAAQAAGAARTGTAADRRGGASADRRDPAHDRPFAAAAV